MHTQRIGRSVRHEKRVVQTSLAQTLRNSSEIRAAEVKLLRKNVAKASANARERVRFMNKKKAFIVRNSLFRNVE